VVQANGAPRGAVGQSTWWSYLTGAASSAAAEEVDAAPIARPQSTSPTASSATWQSGVWQSIPTKGTHVDAGGSEGVGAASNRSSFSQCTPVPGFAKPCPLPSPAQEPPGTERLSTTAKLAEGLQERFSSISRLSTFISSKRHPRQSCQSLEPVVPSSAAGANLPYACTGWDGEAPTPARVEASDGDSEQGLWQVMWRQDSVLRVLPFKSSPDVRLALQHMVCAPTDPVEWCFVSQRFALSALQVPWSVTSCHPTLPLFALLELRHCIITVMRHAMSQ
jgi:hypothetical protein